MKINRVTITGIDKVEDIPELVRLQKEHPFVEWGVLFSKTCVGTPRYPDPYVISQFGVARLNMSAHICGQKSYQIMETINGTDLLELLQPEFKRAQINYNFTNRENKEFDLRKMVLYAQRHPDFSLIFQYNGNNARFLDFLITIPKQVMPQNIHFLFDASEGRGEEIEKISAPFNSYTGYAGGITPENVESICQKISSMNIDDEVWIDMESGVRDENNVLSIEKVESVLKIVAKFIV